MNTKVYKAWKLSELLDASIRDLRKIEKDDKYEIDMYDFHTGSSVFYKTCRVCLAGAFLAKTLKYPISFYYSGKAFLDSRYYKGCQDLDGELMGVIDSLRTLDSALAFYYLERYRKARGLKKYSYSKKKEALAFKLSQNSHYDENVFGTASYYLDPRGYVKRLKDFSKTLKEAGL